MKRGTPNPWGRFGLPARAGWLVGGGYTIAVALTAAISIGGWPGGYLARPVNQLVPVLSLLFTAGCAGNAARCAGGRRRLGWLALTAALAGWTVGEVICALSEVCPQLDHAAHPTAAEMALWWYPVGATASLVLLSDSVRRVPWRLILDGVIVATSLFVASWVFILNKVVRDASSSRPVIFTHVFADVVVMTVAILVLSRTLSGARPSLSLLAGGITVIGGVDIVIVFQTGIGGYHTGELVDLPRVAGQGLVALAALASVRESPTAVSDGTSETGAEVTSRIRLWLPYLPLVLAAAIGLGHLLDQVRRWPFLFAALGILVAAALARQLVVLVENQALLAEVAQEASRDSLTGLANRTRFLGRLERAIAARDQRPTPIAVLCLDLDNFKQVNDALGHPAGDELLVRVASLLTASLDETTTIARLGGDEFAVLIEGSVEETQAAAHRVLGAFDAAIVIDGVPVTVRPSIGYTVATAGSNCTVDELLRHADLAMYAAKREGGERIRSFVPDVPVPDALTRHADAPISTISVAPETTPACGTAVDSGGPTVPGQDKTAPLLRRLAGFAAATPAQRDRPPRRGVRWPPVGVRIALALLTIGVAVYTALTVHAGHRVFAESWYPALNLLAAAVIAARAYHIAAGRVAWSLIAAGQACSALGDVVYWLWVPDGQSPSSADPFYLAFYPFGYAGLLLLIRARLKRVPVAVRLDSLICGLAGAAVAAALTAGPIHAAAARAPATVLVGLVYPWGDLVLLALAAGMLPILGLRNEFRWILLVAGFTLFAAADTLYLLETAAGSYRVGTWFDALWPASSLLVAVASWAPWSSAEPAPKRGLGSYATPVAGTVVALGVIVLGPHSRIAGALAALSLIAVAARFPVAFRDVSVLAETHQHAMTDALTALPNRRSLATALTALSVNAPDLAPRAPARRALLLLHLYEFDEITGSVGRHLAEELLCRIANRLSQHVRPEDLLARTGDSEFAILLSDGADLIAARAQAGRLLDAFGEPFKLDPITVQVDARIAIALYPDHCDHPQELLNRAETAIPHTKSAKSKVVAYDSAFELYRDSDPALVDDLRAALSNGNELICHYQPKINADDGSVHSVEALLRWQHPSRGMLLPEEFLPAAERAGLMRRVANRTLDLALAQLRSWRDQGMNFTVAVNLSTTNLLDLDLEGTIEGLLKAHGVPADALIIEITESTLADSVRSRNTVAALQHLGVRISLDDYGTGWSSLARLQDVSVDELKLDRVFVARLALDPRSVAIVRSTVALAHSLEADLVAEGVEDEVTLSALRRYGCTITQGFVHSPPLPADEVVQWINSHVPDPA
ncbi:diguanylate cyclase domain-containing protein [Mycobacterium pseudokansasii]|uniref:diguanylate cyclase domain-containing protein n=1 Tax=Mycobacterium pseudokansasii TaxID=2341080 RepID=UPI000A6C3EAF|nr:diguanylate cyclase [Mycobacterium pseudokansasii]VAZ99256.1 putative signaling protein [Mycobacterium pseudokansasii]VBA30397.1 putative signaling protein [Mycobacterium pseudokansasii]